MVPALKKPGLAVGMRFGGLKGPASWALGLLAQAHQEVQILQAAGLVQRLVGANPEHARKPDRHAAFVARARADAFKTQLENQAGPDASHRAEFLQRGLADDRVNLLELQIGQASIGLGEGDQLQRRIRRSAASGSSPGAAAPSSRGAIPWSMTSSRRPGP